MSHRKKYPCRQAADSLGVSLSAIRPWVSAEKGATGAEQANPGLAEREILKKAAVFLAKENG
ncbi:hypothetical protein GWK90_03725 [Candidatus Hamiltonella defensa]|uniref:Uncharacterized protein n=1 Tax=Candidatus Williamhamiltonella defendens TaxID=138072 RepID=A0AAC9YG09_9ENTR|nr:hypothetical protein [Candidatus Hamiltonella defensa]ASV33209.1 hypothetical protein CJJ18_02960 [Candidatus Hamiltonella defensa]AWK16170.1 hypothetical protein CCS40_02985 [Candidatus Hamiltonella defensa]MBK4361401.1 hypothetical protein [Candidatus Hamiltonella defensa]